MVLSSYRGVIVIVRNVPCRSAHYRYSTKCVKPPIVRPLLKGIPEAVILPYERWIKPPTRVQTKQKLSEITNKLKTVSTLVSLQLYTHIIS